MQLAVASVLHIGSVLPVLFIGEKSFFPNTRGPPVEEGRMVLHNDGQLIALTGACDLGHIGWREEEQGEGGALVDGGH